METAFAAVEKNERFLQKGSLGHFIVNHAEGGRSHRRLEAWF